MILGLDHVAIAVHDLPTAVRRFAEDLGIACTSIQDVHSASTTTAFLPIAGPTSLEIVAPLDHSGPLVRHLAKRGPGLHHLCFRTDDIAGDMRRLLALGYRFTTPAPTSGAHGSLVAFLHPASTGGVLIELTEHP